MSKKTYTESEIASILGRAARLQARRTSSDGEQLTLDEIKQAATEAGIDRRYVELAASSSKDHRPSYLNIPTGAGRTQFVQGTLDDRTWEKMVALFAREFGGPAKNRSLETRREWVSGNLLITAEEIDGQTVLNAHAGWEQELEGPLALSVVGAITSLTAWAVAFLGEEFMIGVAAALLTILVVAGFSAYHVRTSGRREDYRQRFESIMDRCAELILGEKQPKMETGTDAERISPGRDTESGKNRQPRSEIDVPDEEEGDPEAPQGNKRTRS